MLDRIHVLWRHYSSWALYLIIGLSAVPAEQLQELGLPSRIVTALAVFALVLKLIKQRPPEVSK